MFDFTGGWNTRKPPILLAPNELERADNIRPLQGGGFQKRRGYIRVGNDDSNTQPVTGLHCFSTPSGTDHMLRTKNAKIEYYNAGTWTDITGALTVTTTVNVKHNFATFRGNAVGTNGTDIPWKWPGTGNAAVIARAIGGGADTIDKTAVVATHRERLVLGDVTATETAVQTRYESVIWPSDVGTLDTWSAAPTGKIHIGQGDGDSITCLLSLLDYLIVFKQHSMWRVTELGDSTNQRVVKVADIGTLGARTAIYADGKIYFISASGLLWSYDPRQGDSPDALEELTTEKIGDRPLAARTVTHVPYWHLTYLPLTREIVWFFNDTNVGAGSAQNAAWVYNIPLRAYARWQWDKSPNVSTHGPYPGTILTESGAPFFGTGDGFVGWFDTANVYRDDSTGASSTITMTTYLAPVSCDSPGTVKKWNWAYLVTNSQQGGEGTAPGPDTITLVQDNVLPADDSTGASLTHTLTMPAQAGATSDMYDSMEQAELSGHGKWIRFRLSHTANKGIRVAGLMLNYDLRGPRRPV